MPDWERAGVKLPLSDIVAAVIARGMSDPLFPQEIDQTLATMSLNMSRISLPSASVTMTVSDFCFDRIDVLTEGEIDQPSKDNELRFELAAITAANTFLGHCRVAARAPFITGIEQHFRLQDGQLYTLTPWTIAWYDALTGETLPFYEETVNACASAGAYRSPERGAVAFSKIVDSMRAGEDPDLIRSLLLDAEERVVTLRTREAILSMAASCELAANRYLRRMGMANDPQVKLLLSERGKSFAEKRLHAVPLHLSGRSLRKDDLSTFTEVEQLYRARNAVAHEARVEFLDDGVTVAVDLSIATRFLAAATKTADWLQSL